MPSVDDLDRMYCTAAPAGRVLALCWLREADAALPVTSAASVVADGGIS